MGKRRRARQETVDTEAAAIGSCVLQDTRTEHVWIWIYYCLLLINFLIFC